MLKHYMEVFLGIFSGSSQGSEGIILVGGAILLIIGIVNLFIRKFRVRGIFMIISALFYSVLFCLSLNLELDQSFMIAAAVVAVVLNILNWLFACGISFTQLLKGIGGLVIILAIGSGVLGFIGGVILEFLPKDIPCLWQFFLLIFLFVLDLAAFVGASIVKSDTGELEFTSDYDDTIRWATGNEQSVDTVSMWSDSDDSGSDSGDVY